MSKFLVIDGLDGSGKGSVTRMLRAYLTEKGIGNDLISFPMYEKENSVLIADRYTTANAVHQLTKLPKEQWDGFLDWLFDFEYTKLGLPAPDHTFYIEMPPALCRRMIAKRAEETGRTVDIHEKDPTHLDRAYRSALYASEKLGWTRIASFRGEEPRPLKEVFEELLAKAGL